MLEKRLVNMNTTNTATITTRTQSAQNPMEPKTRNMEITRMKSAVTSKYVPNFEETPSFLAK